MTYDEKNQIKFLIKECKDNMNKFEDFFLKNVNPDIYRKYEKYKSSRLGTYSAILSIGTIFMIAECVKLSFNGFKPNSMELKNISNGLSFVFIALLFRLLIYSFYFNFQAPLKRYYEQAVYKLKPNIKDSKDQKETKEELLEIIERYKETKKEFKNSKKDKNKLEKILRDLIIEHLELRKSYYQRILLDHSSSKNSVNYYIQKLENEIEEMKKEGEMVR